MEIVFGQYQYFISVPMHIDELRVLWLAKGLEGV